MPESWPASYRSTYYPHAVDLASAKPLTLAAGERISADIEIAHQAGVRVAGQLVRPAGVPSSSGSLIYTSVALTPEQDIANSNGPFTSGQDEYEFNDVLPGKYTIVAVTRDASSDPFGGNQKVLFGFMQHLEVAAHDMNGVDLNLQPVRDLAGAIAFPDGCTPFPVTVDFDSRNQVAGGQTKIPVGTDGKFTAHSLATGHFTVSVSRPDVFVRVASMRLGDRDVVKDGFDAPLSSDEPLLIQLACGNSGRQP
jgi:hypothetical protein